jgi:pteridine reductase
MGKVRGDIVQYPINKNVDYNAMVSKHQSAPVALITGAARRVGACIAAYFHTRGYCVIVHYRHSHDEAHALVNTLNAARAHSAVCLFADLDDPRSYDALIEQSVKVWGHLNVLINNASTFTPTPVGTMTAHHVDYLFNSNFKAPLFLSQAAAPLLSAHQGCIVNIVDIHARTPMKNYPLYSCAKAALFMLTQSLALELAPHVRVNAVAPGNVLWPEHENKYTDEKKQALLKATLLQKQVKPEDIANTTFFLAEQTAITGQMIAVDGGRIF